MGDLDSDGDNGIGLLYDRTHQRTAHDAAVPDGRARGVRRTRHHSQGTTRMNLPAGSEAATAALALRNTDHPWLRPDDLSIPMLSSQAQRVLVLVGDPEVTIATLAAVVSKDPVLATRVLGIANSAVYGAMTPLRSVSDAVVRLGTRTVRNVVVTVSMHSQFKSADVYGHDGRSFMEHAVGTAYVAHLI